MRRDSKLVRGLVDWLLGGISARLDFIERDVESLQKNNRELAKNQQGMAKVVMAHHAQLQQQAEQMIALRKMHMLLADKVGKPFPGQRCETCGNGLVFERAAAEKAYRLVCPKGCGKSLLLPEANLLSTLSRSPE